MLCFCPSLEFEYELVLYAMCTVVDFLEVFSLNTMRVKYQIPGIVCVSVRARARLHELTGKCFCAVKIKLFDYFVSFFLDLLES